MSLQSCGRERSLERLKGRPEWKLTSPTFKSERVVHRQNHRNAVSVEIFVSHEDEIALFPRVGWILGDDSRFWVYFCPNVHPVLSAFPQFPASSPANASDIGSALARQRRGATTSYRTISLIKMNAMALLSRCAAFVPVASHASRVHGAAASAGPRQRLSRQPGPTVEDRCDARRAVSRPPARRGARA